jgi:hypothetical protein
MKRLLAVLVVLVALLAPTLALSSPPATAAAPNSATPIVYPCHSDSHMVQNFTGTGQLGRFPNLHRDDPNVGLTAASHPDSLFHTGGGYYYLDIKACSSTIHVHVTTGCWLYQFGSGLSRVQGTVLYGPVLIMGTVDLTYTHAVVGHTYFMRVENSDAKVEKDVSSINSPR